MKINTKFFSLLIIVLLSVTLSRRSKSKSKLLAGNLPDGDTLNQGEYLMSKNDKYKLIMQSNGDLVLYSLTPNNKKDNDNPIWQSKSKGGKGPFKAVLQPEGALVVIDSLGNAIWKSKGMKPGVGPYSLHTQRDGNLVIYDKTGFPTWASQTWKKTLRKHK